MSGLDNTSYTTRIASGVNVTLTNNDSVVIMTNTGAKAVAVPAGSAVQPGRVYFLVGQVAGTAVLTPASGTINGAATYTQAATSSLAIVSDGANWQLLSTT